MLKNAIGGIPDVTGSDSSSMSHEVTRKIENRSVIYVCFCILLHFLQWQLSDGKATRQNKRFAGAVLLHQCVDESVTWQVWVKAALLSSLSVSVSLSHSLSLSLSLSFSLPVSHFLSLSNFLSLSASLSYLFLIPSLSLSLSLFFALSASLSHNRTSF